MTAEDLVPIILQVEDTLPTEAMAGWVLAAAKLLSE